MGGVVSFFEDTVSSVGDAVGSVVSDVVDTAASVVDQVVTPVANAVEKTVDSALKDPVGTAVKVALVASGQAELLPLVNATETVANGGSLEQALTSAATTYVAGEVGSGVGGCVAASTGSDLAGDAARAAAIGLTKSAITGVNPVCAAVGSFVNNQLYSAVAPSPAPSGGGQSCGPVGGVQTTDSGALPSSGTPTNCAPSVPQNCASGLDLAGLSPVTRPVNCTTAGCTPEVVCLPQDICISAQAPAGGLCTVASQPEVCTPPLETGLQTQGCLPADCASCEVTQIAPVGPAPSECVATTSPVTCSSIECSPLSALTCAPVGCAPAGCAPEACTPVETTSVACAPATPTQAECSPLSVLTGEPVTYCSQDCAPVECAPQGCEALCTSAQPTTSCEATCAPIEVSGCVPTCAECTQYCAPEACVAQACVPECQPVTGGLCAAATVTCCADTCAPECQPAGGLCFAKNIDCCVSTCESCTDACEPAICTSASVSDCCAECCTETCTKDQSCADQCTTDQCTTDECCAAKCTTDECTTDECCADQCCECCCDSLPNIPNIGPGKKGRPSAGRPGTGGLPTGCQSGNSQNSAIPWLSSNPELLIYKAAMSDNPFGDATVRPLDYASGGLAFAKGGSYCVCVDDLSQFCKNMPKFGKCLSPDVLVNKISQKSAPTTHGQLKQIMSQISPHGNMGGLAQGGLPAKYKEAAPKGHNPEFVTGMTGYYACGGGTGQSDDIPAMLHDGDYVMDAETVSALGDGSSKAGRNVLDGFRSKIPHNPRETGGKVVPAKIADGEYVFPASFVTALGGGDNKRGAEILDGLREKLRAHKRAAPVNKIPPKAKSPLEYIGKMKG